MGKRLKTLPEMVFPSVQLFKFNYGDGKVSMVEDTIGRRTCCRYDGDLLVEALSNRLGASRRVSDFVQ